MGGDKILRCWNLLPIWAIMCTSWNKKTFPFLYFSGFGMWYMWMETKYLQKPHFLIQVLPTIQFGIWFGFHDLCVVMYPMNLLSSSFAWILNLFSYHIYILKIHVLLFIGTKFEFTLDDILNRATAFDYIKDGLPTEISN